MDCAKFSAKRNILRGCRTCFAQGLNKDSTTLYNKCVELNNADPFSSNTVQCGNALTNAIALGKRKKWQELIESTDMTHGSRRAWKTIHFLGNDYTKTETKSLVSADQVGHQLLVNSRGNHHHSKRKKLSLVTSDSYTYTRPFTMTEMITAIKALKIIRQHV